MKILSLTQLSALLMMTANGLKVWYAEIQINPGKYNDLSQEFRDFLESEAPGDVKLNKHIKIVDNREDSPIETHKMQFITLEGKAAETILIDHIPVSMAKDMMKEKEWVTPETKDDL